MSKLENTHKIQLKRGTQAALEQLLIDENKPASGELLFELPSLDYPAGRLKIGTGFLDYKDLPYLPDTVTMDNLLAKVNTAVIDVQNMHLDVTKYAADAEIAANRAETAKSAILDIPEKTINQVQDYMEDKLKFMSMESFNNLESITPNSFYFISIDD